MQPLRTVIELLGKTSGRDKVNRLVTYFSKYLIYSWEQANAPADLVKRAKVFNKSVGGARKLMRIARPLEFISNILELNTKDSFVRVATIVKNVALTGWLYNDMYLWFNSAGVTKLLDAGQTKRTAAWFWLVGLVFGTLLLIYKLRAKLAAIRALKTRIRANAAEDGAEAQLAALRAEYSKTARGLLKTGLDLMLPLQRLGLVPLTDGTIGLLGTFTSLVAGYDEVMGASKRASAYLAKKNKSKSTKTA